MVSKATPRSSRARRNCSPNAVAPPACAMSLSFEAATRPYHKRSHALNQRNLPIFRIAGNLPGTLLLHLSGHCLAKLLALARGKRADESDSNLPVESDRLDERLDRMPGPAGEALCKLLGGGCSLGRLRIGREEPEYDADRQDDCPRLLQKKPGTF